MYICVKFVCYEQEDIVIFEIIGSYIACLCKYYGYGDEVCSSRNERNGVVFEYSSCFYVGLWLIISNEYAYLPSKTILRRFKGSSR